LFLSYPPGLRRIQPLQRQRGAFGRPKPSPNCRGSQFTRRWLSFARFCPTCPSPTHGPHALVQQIEQATPEHVAPTCARPDRDPAVSTVRCWCRTVARAATRRHPTLRLRGARLY